MATAALDVGVNLSGILTPGTALAAGLANTSKIAKTLLNSYTSGTGANQINEYYFVTGSLASTTINFDVVGGTLRNGIGDLIDLTAVKVLVIGATTATSGYTLDISGNLFEDIAGLSAAETHRLGANGFYAISDPIDGVTTTAGTGDTITLDSGSNTVDYFFFIGGLT